ncbi:MAG TPA: PAS domain-containing protein [Polyangia bacterium]
MTPLTAGDDGTRETAERAAFVANALPALLGYVDANMRYAWVNEGYCRWFGRPLEAIVGRQVSEVVDATTWTNIRPYVGRALAGEEVAFDNTALFKDGTAHVVRASYVPHRDGSGRVRGFGVLVSDISETKRVETALRRSERMLDQAQAAAQVGSWELTFDESLREIPGSSLWSNETYRLLGYPPGTPASLARFRERVHSGDGEPLKARTAHSLERLAPFETEYRIVHPDRSVRVLHAWLYFERAPDGMTTRVFGTCQDITERKQAELEVRRARAQLELVLESTPAFIARYDRERQLVWANRSYAARFGKTPEELAGIHLAELVGAEAAGAFDPFFTRALAGESIQVELEVPYATGARFVHLIASPTLDPAGVVDGAVVVLSDLTHRRLLERERERAMHELQEADRRKDEFLGMLAHELRNPLAPILNGVEVLQNLAPGQTELAGQYQTIIARQAHHMKRLLDDLLDVSRVSLGKIQLVEERVDANALLQQAVEATRPAIAEKRQVLALALAPRPLMLNADPTRLVQVFANLISNAVKYTDAGGHVTVTSTVEGGEAVVSVRDDGVGMTPELLTRAFDLFVQETRSLDRAQGGLGIGLTLVRTLVKMHGGSVQAFSEGPGRGSELVVRLPLGRETTPSRADAAPAAREGVRAALRVLVVDDSVDAAAGVGKLMQILGHEVALAHDGPAALAAAAAAPPDLILLDIGLPGMAGYEVAARLRATGHTRAALVAVTGYGREDDVRRSRDAGFDHHLVKPVDLAQLRKIVAALRNAGEVQSPDGAS